MKLIKLSPPENVGNRLFTVPTVSMTIPRPLLMAKAMRHLWHGNVNKAIVYAGISALSDLESPAAAVTEHFLPGWGFSGKGAKADQASDSLALMAASVGIIANPRVHWLARIGVGLITLQEIRKIKQAKGIVEDYRALTGTHGLPTITSTNSGQNSMAEKLVATAGAVGTAHEKLQPHPILRFAAGLSVLGASIEAYREANVAQGEYRTTYYDQIRPGIVASQAATLTIGSTEPLLTASA